MTGHGKTTGLHMPSIVPGEWCGDLVGAASVNFGQVVQSGPPRQSVELTYVVAPVALTMPDGAFTWPGVLMMMAPTLMKTEFADAGALFQVQRLPSLSLSLQVTRAQFSDMLPRFEAGQFREFHFTLEDEAGGNWPVHSWGMGTP